VESTLLHIDWWYVSFQLQHLPQAQSCRDVYVSLIYCMSAVSTESNSPYSFSFTRLACRNSWMIFVDRFALDFDTPVFTKYSNLQQLKSLKSISIDSIAVVAVIANTTVAMLHNYLELVCSLFIMKCFNLLVFLAHYFLCYLNWVSSNCLLLLFAHSNEVAFVKLYLSLTCQMAVNHMMDSSLQ